MADIVNGRPRPAAEQSSAELVQRASEQLSRLVREELALARAELTEKGKHAGLAAGLLGGGGALMLYGVGALTAAIALLLALAIPGWAAALTVSVMLFGIAGVFALVGQRQVKRATPPVPTAAASGVRADADTVRAAATNRGRG